MDNIFTDYLFLILMSFCVGFPLGGIIGVYMGKDRDVYGYRPRGSMPGTWDPVVKAYDFKSNSRMRESIVIGHLLFIVVIAFMLNNVLKISHIQWATVSIFSILFAFLNFKYGKRPKN